jgi:hypothetical protein
MADIHLRTAEERDWEYSQHALQLGDKKALIALYQQEIPMHVERMIELRKEQVRPAEGEKKNEKA